MYKDKMMDDLNYKLASGANYIDQNPFKMTESAQEHYANILSQEANSKQNLQKYLNQAQS